jgi:hypothetical protein
MMLWIKKIICYFRGHNFEHFADYSVCARCGKVTFSRAQLLKQLLPGLKELFGVEYAKYEKDKT